MRYLFCIVFFIIFFAGCSSNVSYENKKSNVAEKTTLLIQIHSNTPQIDQIISESVFLANTIIKQELGLEHDYNFDFFLPKQRQRISLYYLNDFVKKDESALFTAIEGLIIRDPHLLHILHNVFATSTVEMLGEQNDELVMMMNDQDKELMRFHQMIKELMRALNFYYETDTNTPLFDVAKSERFPFEPHMGLGRVRIQSIKNHIKDESQAEVILQRIRERIKTEVSDLIQKSLGLGALELPFDRLAIWVPKKQTYIKEWIKK